DVGRGVARDDRARPLDLHLGLERWQLLQRLPPVVEDMTRQRLVAAGGVDAGAAAAPPVGADPQSAFLDDRIGHGGASTVEGGNVGAADLFHPWAPSRGAAGGRRVVSMNLFLFGRSEQ